jgi:uncharacterized membrane protein YeiH
LTLLHILDISSTFIFALVGSRVAADKGLDYGGIAFVAAIASVAGGTLRNVLLGLRPNWLSDPWIICSVILAFLIILLFRKVTRLGNSLLILDTFGLAIAAISGAQLSLESGTTWFAAILLGLITAVTGGLLRDVLCQLEPVLLHRETIGTSALLGVSVFVALGYVDFSQNISALIGGLTVLLTRFVSIKFDLHLPKYKR